MTDLAPTVVTALAAVAGSLVGGLTSFATGYYVQRGQWHTQHVMRDLERREELYAHFNELAAQLILDGLDHELDDPGKLIGIEALAGRIRLSSSAAVLKAAEGVIAHIMAGYARPPVDPRKEVLTNTQEVIEPLVTFSKVCREERLEMLRGI
jgi:hypothetical protein